MLTVPTLLYSRPSNVVRMEEGRSSFQILAGTPVRKRPLGSPRRRWKGNIRMDLKEKGINTRILVDSAHDREYWRVLVNAVLHLRDL